MFTGKGLMLTVDFDYLHLKPGIRVLDAGCGTGRHLCEAFRSPGVDVVGIDMNLADLAKTRDILIRLKREDNGSWITAMADVTTLPFKDESFDVIICSEVLEHVPENVLAIKELIRVLKPGKDIVVSVPSCMPERICWAISESYFQEPGGHIRIYKKKELKNLLENAGAKCWKIRYKHALHAPYWWLKCMVGHNNESSRLVNLYKKFLEWDIMTHPAWTRRLDKFLNPIMAKSIVFYLKKGR
jgi:2-polyprenyl-3-methyl-5-hydroxy-6-metoxy-1,4-benzoquinol methylase